MRKLEFALCGLLALAGLGHFVGTFAFYEAGTEIFVWSLSAAAFVFTLVFLHVLRIMRRVDRPVAFAAITGSVVWSALALAFGQADPGILDPRVLMHVAAAGGLAITSIVALRGQA